MDTFFQRHQSFQPSQLVLCVGQFQRVITDGRGQLAFDFITLVFGSFQLLADHIDLVSKILQVFAGNPFPMIFQSHRDEAANGSHQHQQEPEVASGLEKLAAPQCVDQPESDQHGSQHENDADDRQFTHGQYLVADDIVDIPFQFMSPLIQLVDFLFQLKPSAQTIDVPRRLFQRGWPVFADRSLQPLLVLPQIEFRLVDFILQSLEPLALFVQSPSRGLQAAQ